MLVERDESASSLTTGTASGGQIEESNQPAVAVEGFERALAAVWNPKDWCETHTVIAVSGGADSVALLRAMASLKTTHGGEGELVIAHLNHGLRDDADSDAAWLSKLCRQLGLRLEVGSADVTALRAERGDGLESAARQARYAFLTGTAERLGARFVATAHTADDQVETILQRIVRGTGLRGLAGIPSRRRLADSVSVVRPLLSASRREVLEYLAGLDQDYRTDSTNGNMAITRNRLRGELLPELRRHYNGEVDAALMRLASQASETQHAIELLAAGLAKDCVDIRRDPAFDDAPAETNVEIRCSILGGQPEVLVREVCKLAWREADWPMQAMGFCEWQKLSQVVISQQPCTNFPSNVLARRAGDRLLLSRASLS